MDGKGCMVRRRFASENEKTEKWSARMYPAFIKPVSRRNSAGKTMKRSLSAPTVLFTLLFAIKPSFGQAQRALLTVDDLNIPAGGALAAFRIETWGVEPLAVCKVPPLWELKEEEFMDSAGFLSGRSDPYHRTLEKLDQMYLVDVYGYQPLPKGDPKGEYHPAPAGWYEVFDGNGDVLRKRRVFRAGNFHLTPAQRCPDAPPSEP